MCPEWRSSIVTSASVNTCDPLLFTSDSAIDFDIINSLHIDWIKLFIHDTNECTFDTYKYSLIRSKVYLLVSRMNKSCILLLAFDFYVLFLEGTDFYTHFITINLEYCPNYFVECCFVWKCRCDFCDSMRIELTHRTCLQPAVRHHSKSTGHL